MKTSMVVALVAVSSFAAMACAHAEGGSVVAVAPGEIAGVDAVDLNLATAPDLIALPGIGPAKAAAILAYRTRHGAFSRVDDLRKVKGFGRKSIARLRPVLKVSRPPPAGSANESAERPVAAR